MEKFKNQAVKLGPRSDLSYGFPLVWLHWKKNSPSKILKPVLTGLAYLSLYPNTSFKYVIWEMTFSCDNKHEKKSHSISCLHHRYKIWSILPFLAYRLHGFVKHWLGLCWQARLAHLVAIQVETPPMEKNLFWLKRNNSLSMAN